MKKDKKAVNAVFDLKMDFVRDLQGSKQKASEASLAVTPRASQIFEQGSLQEDREILTVPDIVSYN